MLQEKEDGDITNEKGSSRNGNGETYGHLHVGSEGEGVEDYLEMNFWVLTPTQTIDISDLFLIRSKHQ